MADRCDHCSVRMDGLEVHADDCPVRGPEIVAESESLKEENAKLRAELENHANCEFVRGTVDLALERVRGLVLQVNQLEEVARVRENLVNILGRGLDAAKLQVREYEDLLQRAESWLHRCAPFHERASEVRELADLIHATWERYRAERFETEARKCKVCQGDGRSQCVGPLGCYCGCHAEARTP